MQGQSNIKRAVVSAVAAVLMSSVAVGTAVAPAEVGITPVKSAIHA